MIKRLYDKALQLVGRDGRSQFNRKTRNSIMSNRVSLQSIIGSNVCVFPGTQIDEMSQIHSYAWIGYNCFVTKASIGRYAGVANNVSIGPGEHDVHRVANNACFYSNIYQDLTSKPCIIGPDVWIGVDSIIRRGVEIGVGAIVGANSFVNANVPPYAIVAGSPARIIRFKFNKEQIAKILATKWWDLEQQEAKLVLNRLESELNLACK